MSISIKEKFIEMLPASSAPEINFLNNLNNNDYVIHITTQSSNEHELIKQINQMIDDRCIPNRREYLFCAQLSDSPFFYSLMLFVQIKNDSIV
jgi:hypothetical protein